MAGEIEGTSTNSDDETRFAVRDLIQHIVNRARQGLSDTDSVHVRGVASARLDHRQLGSGHLLDKLHEIGDPLLDGQSVDWIADGGIDEAQVVDQVGERYTFNLVVGDLQRLVGPDVAVRENHEAAVQATCGLGDTDAVDRLAGRTARGGQLAALAAEVQALAGQTLSAGGGRAQEEQHRPQDASPASPDGSKG